MPSPRFTRSFTRPAAAFALLLALALATPARADVPSWPRQFDSPSGSFVIYQPQPEDLTGDMLTGRAAFSLQKSPDANPTFGVLWFSELIEIDRDSSTVTVRNLDVTKVRLPGITPAEASRYEQLVEAEATQWDLTGSLEELQAGLAATEKERESVAGLDNAPPRILFSPQRAILVAYDGAPTLEPIEGSNLERVANTPYAVVYDPSSRGYYLNGANLWYAAKDPLGPWTDISAPPAAVRAAVPPDTSAEDQAQGSPPLVLTATEPTELISTDGPPRYAPLVDGELLYVTNTESDVLREVNTQALYVLLAGRWYRAATQDGPWTFVRGDQLPASFKLVPPDSPKGNILASVAGTDQADDAVADAEIPQTSAIRRSDSGFEVSYDGSPQFEPIPGTSLQYAVNTDAEVIFADGRYYACDQGVWYIADSPDGPWTVSETRPLGVDDIPPGCPVYDVRYVYIYDVTPSFVYTGYLPGYVGCYPYYGTVFYGTGYRYRPWRGRHHYYPRPCTWGFQARYNPWLSRWSFGFSYGTGFLRVGYRWRSWQPQHRQGPPLWFGPGGYHRPLVGRDMALLRAARPGRPRPRPADRAPANLYNRPETIARVDRTAARMPVRPVTPLPAQATRRPNNVFAGKDGKVYQRDDSGKWKVNEGRTWKPARMPVASPAMPSRKGGGAAGGPTPTPRPSRPEVQLPPRPMPVEAPAERPAEPRGGPATRSVPPTISSGPGNLEREYRARQRASEGAYSGAPATRPEPAKPASPPKERQKDRTPPERKR